MLFEVLSYKIFVKSINERRVKIVREFCATVWEYLGRCKKMKKHIYSSRYEGIPCSYTGYLRDIATKVSLRVLQIFFSCGICMRCRNRRRRSLSILVFRNWGTRKSEIVREILPTFVRRCCGFVFDLLGIAVSCCSSFPLQFTAWESHSIPDGVFYIRDF